MFAATKGSSPKGIRPDLGGPFMTTRWTPIVDRILYSSRYTDWYNRIWEGYGNMVPSIHSSYGTAFEGWGYITKDSDVNHIASKFPALSSTDDELIAYGTTAIAKTRPDISPVNVTNFLVELRRDGIPFAAKLSKSRLEGIIKRYQDKAASAGKTSAKEGSDIFLENTFGLQPFVSDLKDFVRMQSKGISTLDNLLTNSGKLIRRRYRFPDNNFYTTLGRAGANQFGFDSQFNWSNEGFFINYGDFRRPIYEPEFTVHTERKAWFSGAYVVHMPPDMEPVSRLRAAADKLRWDYGVGLDIDTVYNLIPWSWLLDWQLNLGDLITNVAKWQDDAVVLQYGYMMEETKSTYMVSPVPGSQFNGNTTPIQRCPDMGIKVHKKRRIRATPYGFGLTYGSLSDYQKAILAAIGITRF
jgi:hypothetical protein